MQKKGKFPSDQEDALAIGVVRPERLRIEHLRQSVGRLVKLLGMGISNGPPIIDGRPQIRPMVGNKVKEALGFGQFLGRGASFQE